MAKRSEDVVPAKFQRLVTEAYAGTKTTLVARGVGHNAAMSPEALVAVRD